MTWHYLAGISVGAENSGKALSVTIPAAMTAARLKKAINGNAILTGLMACL